MTVILSHPVQYFSPLFDLLTNGGEVVLTVVYYNDAGLRATWDDGFRLNVQWDIDLTSGHSHEFLTMGDSPSHLERLTGLRRLGKLIRDSDVVVIHGYATTDAVAAIGLCKVFSVPYLLRADTSYRASRHWPDPRHWWPRLACQMSAGALSVGERNGRVMAELGCPQLFHAPFGVDHTRFRSAAEVVRRDPEPVRFKFGVPPCLPVVAFAGKFTAGKRAADLIAAVDRLDRAVHVLFIGDGPEREKLEHAARNRSVTFTGFLNQVEMPHALACADVVVLPSSYEAWGLVINEALACGCVPVVSDAVGCAPDLVAGLGEVYPTGNVEELVLALNRALDTSASPDCYANLLNRLSLYDLAHCASQYEVALTEVASRERTRRRVRFSQ